MLLIMGCMFSKTQPEIPVIEPITTISALFDSSKDAQERMMELREVERMESSRGSIPLETSEELSFKRPEAARVQSTLQAEHILQSGSRVT